MKRSSFKQVLVCAIAQHEYSGWKRTGHFMKYLNRGDLKEKRKTAKEVYAVFSSVKALNLNYKTE